MSGKNDSDRKALILLADAFIEDILKMSDEEILKEFREEEGGDPARNRRDVLEIVGKAALSANKSRMAAAKTGALASLRTSRRTPEKTIDVASARKRLRSLIERSQSDPTLTMAARNEEELSDEDVFGILEDLEELGSLGQRTEDTED